MHVSQLHRVRWAVRATLALGVAASVTANILHAQPNPISQAIAAWPPLALLVTIELISRVPVYRRWLAAARLLATAVIAGIAAWVSYWHMAAVAARYGETGASSYLLPLSVDGLIIVASVSLVELAGRIRAAEEARPPASVPEGRTPAPVADREPAVPPLSVPSLSVPSRNGSTPEPSPALQDTTGRRTGARRTTTGPRTRAAAPRPRRPVAETAALAAAIEATQPDLTAAEIAQQLGITTSRLRAVRRETRELQTAS